MYRIATFVLLSICACDRTSDTSRPVGRSAEGAGAASSEEPDHAPLGVRPGSHEDWCAGHGVPESKCTRCNPELITAFEEAGDWCDEHGLPESQCLICHPDLVIARPAAAAAPVADWCMGHGLPESKCTKCNQSLIAEFKANGDWCEAHGFPESVCPLCNPQQAPAGAEEAAIEARTVRLDSPDLERAAGIQTELVEQHRGTASIECAARIAFDADRIAHVRAVVPGIVRRVRVERGATVKRGASLFELESTRVGEIQGALQSAREHVRTARANLERKRELEASGAVSVRAVELAKQELASARAEASAAESTLRMTGAARSAPSGRYTLTAPIGGTIVRRPAVVGLIATEIESLATIADTSVMWVLCEVPEAHTSKISLGQRINVTVQGSEDADIEGEIKWIAAEVDPRTRTVTARAEVPNPSGRLRANQFATARIEIGSPRSTTSVPRSAVQRIRDLEVVFVRTAEGVYGPRVVQRHGDGERVQVAGRLQPGESVVTTGAVLLRTEIMPGSIGAGCCEAVQQKGD